MQKVWIFCDESRQCSERYMALGGVIVDDDKIKTFNGTLQKFKDDNGISAELKWQKVSKSFLEKYIGFTSHLFALTNTNTAHFRCIIIDTHQINHKKYNQNDKELGFYKFYYQLLLNCFIVPELESNKSIEFHIRLDYRTTKYSLTDLKDILNAGIKKKVKVDNNVVKSLEPMDSQKSPVLQINDVILGAIGYQKNGFHLLEGASLPKLGLANYIAESAGVESLANNTPFGVNRFKIWNFKLRAK